MANVRLTADPRFYGTTIPRRTLLLTNTLLHFKECISIRFHETKEIDLAIFSDEFGVEYQIPLTQLLNAEGSIKKLIGSSESIGMFLERLLKVTIRVSDTQYILVPLNNGNMRPKRVLVLDI